MKITISHYTFTEYDKINPNKTTTHYKLFDIIIEEPESGFKIIKTPCYICGKELELKIRSAEEIKHLKNRSIVIAIILLVFVILIIKNIHLQTGQEVTGTQFVFFVAAFLSIIFIIKVLHEFSDSKSAKMINKNDDSFHKLIDKSDRSFLKDDNSPNPKPFNYTNYIK
jgi:hypothetical protein